MTPVLPQPAAKASVWLIVTAPHVSLPVAEPCVAGVVPPVHSTVVFAGQVIDGLVVSTTAMVWLQALEQMLEVTFRNNEKVSSQTVPEIMLTVCWFVAPEMDALPVTDQE